jgi:hypothetical protein
VVLLIVVSGSIFLLFGALHGALTLRDLRHPQAFTPPDAALRLAMQQSTIRLDPSINLWRAWLGFNLTHSLGLVMFGGALLHVGLSAPAAFATSVALQAVAIGIAAIYLVVSWNYFFVRPTIGSAVGLGCLVLAGLLAWA